MKLDLISYNDFYPKIGKEVLRTSSSTVIGNTVIGSKSILKERAVLRGDGAEIIVGKEVIFLDRSTVHVASDFMGSYIGDGSIIGRFSLVHACKIGKSVILGDQAIVMDGSEIGDNCGGDATCIINQTAAASEGEWSAENARDFYLKLDDFECFNEL